VQRAWANHESQVRLEERKMLSKGGKNRERASHSNRGYKPRIPRRERSRSRHFLSGGQTSIPNTDNPGRRGLKKKPGWLSNKSRRKRMGTHCKRNFYLGRSTWLPLRGSRQKCVQKISLSDREEERGQTCYFKCSPQEVGISLFTKAVGY